MAIVAFTAFFGSDSGRGWSETHHRNLTDPAPELLAPLQNFKTLMDNFRRPMLGRDRYLQGLRASYRTASGAIASSAIKYTPLAYPGNQREGCAPSVAAKVRMGDITNTKFSDIFLRGFWDAVEVDEELNFGTAAGTAWKLLADQYVAALVTGGYGWLGTNTATTPRGRITDYAPNVDNEIEFTVQINNGTTMPAAGSLVQFRAARLNGSDSPLNRTFSAVVQGPTVVRTVKRVAAGPFVSDGTFTIRLTTFIQYTGAQYWLLAKRAEGKVSGLSPGRAPKKALY